MSKDTSRSIRLADCVTIRLGQSFRKSVIEDPRSAHFVIQTKDLLPGSRLSTKLMSISTLSEVPKPNVKVGDIVVLCRGVRFNAGVVRELPGLTTAQNMFHILQLKPDSELLPEFIASYINTPATQEHFKSLAKGATVQHLKVDDLGCLRIPVPPIETQHTFVALADAVSEEQALLGHLGHLRKQQLSALLGTL